MPAPTSSSVTGLMSSEASESTRASPSSTAWANFIFQDDSLVRLPSENYETYGLGANAYVNDFNDARYDFDKSGFPADRMIWEAFVAVPRFRGERLSEIALYPITLGFGAARSVRGRPQLAEGELASNILTDLVTLSQPFGTKITVRNGVGYVELRKFQVPRFQCSGSRIPEPQRTWNRGTLEPWNLGTFTPPSSCSGWHSRPRA